MLQLDELISSDIEILFGETVFMGTRVPIQTVFWHLEQGFSIDEILQDFPSISKEQITSLIAYTSKFFAKENIDTLYKLDKVLQNPG